MRSLHRTSLDANTSRAA